MEVSNEELFEEKISIPPTPIPMECRTCGKCTNKYMEIYSAEGIFHKLAEKINEHLPIKIHENDSYPLRCCSCCSQKLLEWHTFVLNCIEANVKFKGVGKDCDDKFDDDECIENEYENFTEDIKTKAEQNVASLNPFSDEVTRGVKEEIDAVEDDISTDKTKMAKEETTNQKCIILINCLESLDGNSNSEEGNEGSNNVEESSEQTWPYFCEVCSFENMSEQIVARHIKIEHGITKKKSNKIDREAINSAKVIVDGKIYYNCKLCGKSLHSPYTYTWHMRIHTGERPFVCDLCGKQFRVSQGLVRHVRETHQGIKNFPCDMCGRMFATKRNVEEHRRIHTNERPYVCDLCGKSFKQKASLFVHNRSHTNHFPFRCSYCNQGFRTRPSLMVHITRHTGEKPYPCSICGRLFRIKYELKRHMLIHSEEKPFNCDECGASFRQKRYLKNHLKINHNVISQNS